MDLTAGMHEVTKDEFFAAIGKRDCHPRVEGRWGQPEYRSDFRTPGNQLAGRAIPSCKYDGTPDRYYLPGTRS